jgi:AcrR family transcriptional regulator
MPKIKRAYDARATRTRILDAAMSAFQRGGYHATSMQDLLSASAVPAGSMYHCFATKKDLALAVVRERVATAVRDTWIGAVRDSPNPEREIVGVFRSVAAQIDRRSAVVGCPVTNLAVELSGVDADIGAALEAVYRDWETAVFERLAENRSQRRARELATFVVASFAGSMCMAKSSNSSVPLKRCATVVAKLLQME